MFHSVQYDENLLLRNSYDFFNSSKAVCEGYVDVFYMLGNKCGLDVSYVSSQSKNHVWNAVKIDGEWYNIDMTINIRERTPYRVFLMSDAHYENLTNGNQQQEDASDPQAGTESNQTDDSDKSQNDSVEAPKQTPEEIAYNEAQALFEMGEYEAAAMAFFKSFLPSMEENSFLLAANFFIRA